jgi:hypothetical protein
MMRPSMALLELRQGIVNGQLNVVNKANDANLLNEILKMIAGHLHIRTASMLKRAADLGADFTLTDEKGNGLLHLLAQAQVHGLDTPHFHRHVPEYYAWAIEVLLAKNLSLDLKNAAGETAQDLAQKKGNNGFLQGLRMLAAKQPLPEPTCYIL